MYCGIVSSINAYTGSAQQNSDLLAYLRAHTIGQGLGHISVGDVTSTGITWNLTNVEGKLFAVYDEDNTLVYSDVLNENVCGITTNNLTPGEIYRAEIVYNGICEDWERVSTLEAGNIYEQALINYYNTNVVGYSSFEDWLDV